MNYLSRSERECREYIADLENKIRELDKKYKELSDEGKQRVNQELSKNLPVVIAFRYFLNCIGWK